MRTHWSWLDNNDVAGTRNLTPMMIQPSRSFLPNGLPHNSGASDWEYDIHVADTKRQILSKYKCLVALFQPEKKHIKVTEGFP
jgi:hypothetical protein